MADHFKNNAFLSAPLLISDLPYGEGIKFFKLFLYFCHWWLFLISEVFTLYLHIELTLTKLTPIWMFKMQLYLIGMGNGCVFFLWWWWLFVIGGFYFDRIMGRRGLMVRERTRSTQTSVWAWGRNPLQWALPKSRDLRYMVVFQNETSTMVARSSTPKFYVHFRYHLVPVHVYCNSNFFLWQS